MAENIKFVSDRKFKESLNKEESGQYGVLKGYTPEKVKILHEKQRLVDFIISTEAIDRMGDRVFVDGWDLSAFKKNPIVLFAHDSGSPPIGRAVSIKRDLKNRQLKSRAEFMTADMSPFADSIFRMIVGGFLKATSVGFMPVEFEISEDEERMDGPFRGIDFLKSELMEFSIVPIPANREAVIDAGRKGIDLRPIKEWAEEVLEQWEDHAGLCVPKGTVEKIYKDTTDKKSKPFFRVDSKKKGELRKENLRRLGVLSGDATEYEDDKMPISTYKDTITLTEGDKVQVSEGVEDSTGTEIIEIEAKTQEDKVQGMSGEIFIEDELTEEKSEELVDEIPEEVVEKDAVEDTSDQEIADPDDTVTTATDDEEKGITIGEDEEEDIEVMSFTDAIEAAVELVDHTLDFIDSEDGKEEFKSMVETRSGLRRLNYINDTFKEFTDALDELIKGPEEVEEEEKSAEVVEKSTEVDEPEPVVLELDLDVEPGPEEKAVESEEDELSTDEIVDIIKNHVRETVREATGAYLDRRRGKL